MENRNVNIAGKNEGHRAAEPKVVEVITFDKDAMRQDLTNGLKEFGVGCCEAGKVTLAPLASTMLKHLFNWIICSILQ